MVIGRVRETAEMVFGQADYKDLPVRAVLVSPETDGYIFVEAPDMAEVLRATEEVRFVEKVVGKPASQEDVERILSPRPLTRKIRYGDAVRVTEGEFEGEGGRIESISHSKKEATVKIDTGVVPFSVTMDVSEVKPVTER